MNEQINYCWKANGVTRLEDITPEILRNMIPHLHDVRTVEIVDTVLKRVHFVLSAGDYTIYADPKNGDRFVQFGRSQYLKVNKHDRFDEFVRQEEEEKAQRRIERERKQAEKAAMPARTKRQVSSDSGHYQVDRSYTSIDRLGITAGDILLLTFGNGTQLFVVDSAAPNRRTLFGRRLVNRGTNYAQWTGGKNSTPSRLNRLDSRILGRGRLVLADPKP